MLNKLNQKRRNKNPVTYFLKQGNRDIRVPCLSGLGGPIRLTPPGGRPACKNKSYKDE
jgi:hypothetical protein